MLDPPKWPRLGEAEIDVGAVGRRLSADELQHAQALNGPTGLGDLEFAGSDLHNRRESAKLMIDLVRSEPHEVTLLTLGPLTNVEVAAERAPDFLDLVKEIISLAGSVSAGGDVTPAAEFNAYMNPQAARNVLRSPSTKILVPLDVSQRPILTFDQFDRLKPSGRMGQFLSRLLPYAFRAHHEQLGLEGLRLMEIVALCAVARPRLFSSRPMAVDIETSGELTAGTTVFDRRVAQRQPNNIEVLTDVDAQGVLDYFSEIVAKAA